MVSANVLTSRLVRNPTASLPYPWLNTDSRKAKTRGWSETSASPRDPRKHLMLVRASARRRHSIRRERTNRFEPAQGEASWKISDSKKSSLDPLSANCHQPCFQFSAIGLRGRHAGAEREVHRSATVRDDPGRTGALPGHQTCS